MNRKLKSHYDLTQLKQLTPARIGLARAGSSISTHEMLAFDLDHAQARDAVHLPFDSAAIGSRLDERQIQSICVHSAAADRTTYLQRPDLGRQLDDPSRQRLKSYQLPDKEGYDLAMVIADGLSTRAIHSNAIALIDCFQKQSAAYGWRWAPIVVASQARVALADEIGEILNARLTVILIGERPGLSSADSMGIYLTYAPRIGHTDAQRNCISNIRQAGLSPEKAARQLQVLISAAFKLGLSGVNLKTDKQSQQGITI
ncbi:ethanolamine ammonia-lyase subunit EutC [Desulfobacula sp.]|uniref:ethanolamine ammonia-lyase subunit EutC n=1 Tax=Desulfobacula sp. TaxID=2593537 RepID=UPI00260D0007|nr:ethanolamine ammonia-lyase subunit EutC [Desulfobacula sp.]